MKSINVNEENLPDGTRNYLESVATLDKRLTNQDYFVLEPVRTHGCETKIE